MSSRIPCPWVGGSWLEDTCLTPTVGASFCLPFLTLEGLTLRPAHFLLQLMLLGYFCLFWFELFASNGSVPACLRAPGPSWGAGEQCRLWSDLWDGTASSLPHTTQDPATTLCSLHYPSSLAPQRECELMGQTATDTTGHPRRWTKAGTVLLHGIRAERFYSLSAYTPAKLSISAGFIAQKALRKVHW